MATQEKRKHYRIDSQNLLNYVCYDENGEKVQHGMGRTLNVSETGILLETHVKVEEGLAVSLTIGFKDDLFDIQGKVVNSREGSSGKHEAGIQFGDMDDQAKVFLGKYIQSFRAGQ